MLTCWHANLLAVMFLVKCPHIGKQSAHVYLTFRRIYPELPAQFRADLELQRHFYSAGRLAEVLAHDGLRRRRAFAVHRFLELVDVNHDVCSVGVAAVRSSATTACSPCSAPGLRP